MGGVEELCNCGFSRRNITNDGFQCFSANSVHVTYRGTLHGTEQASSLQLAGFIEQWTAGEQVIPVQGVFLTVASSCSVIIESLREEECGTVTTDPSDSTTNPSDNMASPSDNMPSPSDNTGAIIAGVVVVICVVAIAVAISIAFIVVKSRTKRQVCTLSLSIHLHVLQFKELFSVLALFSLILSPTKNARNVFQIPQIFWLLRQALPLGF